MHKTQKYHEALVYLGNYVGVIVGVIVGVGRQGHNLGSLTSYGELKRQTRIPTIAAGCTSNGRSPQIMLKRITPQLQRSEAYGTSRRGHKGSHPRPLNVCDRAESFAL